jgi:hypothetical protein
MYPFDYMAVFLGKDPKMIESQVFNFHLANKEMKFNLNYLEENELIKNAIKLSLPSLQTKTAFYIDYENSYLSIEKFIEMKQNKFEISDTYFKTIKSNKLKLISPNAKTEFKKNRLKITLLNNQKVLNSGKLRTMDLIPEPSDILIFVT